MMITDSRRRQAISNLGWVDRGSLWLSDGHTVQSIPLPFGEAEWLALSAGTDDHFSVVHHDRGRRLRLAVHTFAQPSVEVATSDVRPGGHLEYAGDAAAWGRVPRYHTSYLANEAVADAGYYLVDSLPPGRLQRLNWFYEEHYDQMYQSVIGVCEIPESSLVLVSIQRHSQLVIFDPDSDQVLGHIRLAGRAGNPRMRFRGGQELWVSDYDTLVRVDTASRVSTGALKLQPTTEDGVSLFIGDFDFTSDGQRGLVARPYSSDVALIDAASFQVAGYRTMSGQPLEVAALSDGRIISRDWNTGALLTALL
jgi:hypothetical protein